jgi:hypothetical protein
VGPWAEGPPRLESATVIPTSDVSATLIYPPSPSDEMPISLVASSALLSTDTVATRVEVSGTGVETSTSSSSAVIATAAPSTPPRADTTVTSGGLGCATIWNFLKAYNFLSEHFLIVNN